MLSVVIPWARALTWKFCVLKYYLEQILWRQELLVSFTSSYFFAVFSDKPAWGRKEETLNQEYNELDSAREMRIHSHLLSAWHKTI